MSILSGRIKTVDRAVAGYTESLRQNPQYVEAYQGWGETYRMKAAYQRMIADCDAGLRIDPNYQWAKDGRERVLRERG